MEGAALLERLGWRLAEVVAVWDETPRARTLLLRPPEWPGHRAGQHVDVRLTAEDGYRAARSYSIASPPDGPLIALTVEHIPDGEVSPYLTREVRAGDRLELRGPIGGHFVWEPSMGGPLFLLAGGSGIVPLMAMLRHRAAAAAAAIAARLLHSCRTPEDALYRAEIEAMRIADPTLRVHYTHTRAAPPAGSAFARRVDEAMLAEVGWPPADAPLAYVCGPTGFVERAAAALVSLGHRAERIRTERFGPSGPPP